MVIDFFKNSNYPSLSATNSSGSPTSSASAAAPNVTSLSYPNASANPSPTVPGNGRDLKKTSSLRHSNIRSPLNVTAALAHALKTQPQQQPQQISPTSSTNSAFQSISLNNNKPTIAHISNNTVSSNSSNSNSNNNSNGSSGAFNSSYLIKKKVLSTSPVPNLNSLSFINSNSSSSGSTGNSNGSCVSMLFLGLNSFHHNFSTSLTNYYHYYLFQICT